MSVQLVSGDLFVNRYEVEAVAHGCNCQGKMGAGIAVTFKKKYPDMFEAYRDLCREGKFTLGSCFYWKENSLPDVFNLGTQRYPGRKASRESIETALNAMKELAQLQGVKKIAIPRIGTGYGRLPWEDVRSLVSSVFEEWEGTLYVYEHYEKGR